MKEITEQEKEQEELDLEVLSRIEEQIATRNNTLNYCIIN